MKVNADRLTSGIGLAMAALVAQQAWLPSLLSQEQAALIGSALVSCYGFATNKKVIAIGEKPTSDPAPDPQRPFSGFPEPLDFWDDDT